MSSEVINDSPDQASEPGTELVAVQGDPGAPGVAVRDGQPGAVAQAVYADVSPKAGDLKPVLPEQWTRANIRATLGRHLGIHWHKGRYHGVRLPLYVTRMLWWAWCGASRTLAGIVVWWHWTAGWALESQAVAAGRPGLNDAMRVHTEGKKTRSKRGRIIAVCAVLLAGALITAVVLAPWWIWPPAVVVLVWALQRRGRPMGKRLVDQAVVAPQWEPLTQPLIVRALSVLGIGEVNRYLKDGREIEFVTPVTRDGPGWRVALNLPYGVTVAEVLDRRDKLASGLRRPTGCVWPEGDDAHAGRLIIYVCDLPLRQMKQPVWPLAKAGKADLFTPIPFGTDQRGRMVALLLMFANLLIGSIPRMGKTVAMRIVLLAAALDVTCELRVFELKGTGDLSPLAKVAHAYGSGADDETIKSCLDSLRQLHDVELIKRAKTISSLGKDVCPESKVTPELAAKRSLGLHPIVFGLDECQEAFAHEEFGRQFEKYALGIIKRGPALGIMLVLATQRPDAASLPGGVTANVGMRFCLRVMDWKANDMVLGTGSYRSGVSATLMSFSDKGCGYLVGAADAAQIVKSFNVNTERADVIAGRARAMRQAAGRLTGFALGESDETETRSFAADVLSVFAADRNLWSETIAQRLAAQIPDVYADVTPEAVASQLRALGIPVKKVREAGGNPRAGCERAAVEAVTPQPGSAGA